MSAGTEYPTVTAGQITNIPSFSVNKGTVAQAVPGFALTKVTWPTEVWDTDASFANSTYTPKVPGKYVFFVRFDVNTPFDGAAYLYKNGTEQHTLRVSTGSQADPQYSGTVMLDMNGTTDFAEVFIYTPNGATPTILGALSVTRFQGHWAAP